MLAIINKALSPFRLKIVRTYRRKPYVPQHPPKAYQATFDHALLKHRQFSESVAAVIDRRKKLGC